MTSAGYAPRIPPSGITRGIVAGTAAALLGAVGWAASVELTHYKTGPVAILVGLLVGVVVARTSGTSPKLPFIGGALALFGCLLGDLLADAAELGRAVGESTVSVVLDMISHPGLVPELFRAGFAAKDVLFWATAAYGGFVLTRRAIASRLAELTALSAALRSTTPAPGGPAADAPVVEAPAAPVEPPPAAKPES